jgi:N-acetylglucosaminyl-diphospho-decaprenol L-rhamnosyltransferase
VSARLAVVTVAHNSDAEIEAFLSSMGVALTTAGLSDVEIVIADNSPDPVGTTRRLALAAGASYLALPHNRGYGAGIQAGMSTLRSDPEYVVVANPDVVVSPDALARLLQATERWPRAGSLGPRILDEQGGTYPSARSLPSLRTGVGHAVLGQLWPANPWSRSYKSEREMTHERPAGWLSGAFVVVRREAYEAVGGFDDAFFMYFEDVDLGRKLAAAGWENVYVPDAVVTHIGARSTSQNSVAMELVHHDSAYLYLSRKYRGPVLAPLRLVLRVGLALRSRWVTRPRA